MNVKWTKCEDVAATTAKPLKSLTFSDGMMRGTFETCTHEDSPLVGTVGIVRNEKRIIGWASRFRLSFTAN